MPKDKKISCQTVVCEGAECSINDFDLSYDTLVYAAGAGVNTFGIAGVKEHCYFLKQVCVCLECVPYMYALYVCLVCMPCMYALYVCLICMPYMYALYVICMPYMYALHVCLICIRHQRTLLLPQAGVPLICIICLVCMPYMHAFFFFRLGTRRGFARP